MPHTQCIGGITCVSTPGIPLVPYSCVLREWCHQISTAQLTWHLLLYYAMVCTTGCTTCIHCTCSTTQDICSCILCVLVCMISYTVHGTTTATGGITCVTRDVLLQGFPKLVVLLIPLLLWDHYPSGYLCTTDSTRYHSQHSMYPLCSMHCTYYVFPMYIQYVLVCMISYTVHGTASCALVPLPVLPYFPSSILLVFSELVLSLTQGYHYSQDTSVLLTALDIIVSTVCIPCALCTTYYVFPMYIQYVLVCMISYTVHGTTTATGGITCVSWRWCSSILLVFSELVLLVFHRFLHSQDTCATDIILCTSHDTYDSTTCIHCTCSTTQDICSCILCVYWWQDMLYATHSVYWWHYLCQYSWYSTGSILLCSQGMVPLDIYCTANMASPSVLCHGMYYRMYY